MDIGTKIKELREQRGYTLEELGNKVGVGKSTVRKWETGMIENMRQDKIAKLADALLVTPSYLLGWDEVEDIADIASHIINNQDELDIAYIEIRKKYDNSDDAGKKEIMTVLNLLRS